MFTTSRRRVRQTLVTLSLAPILAAVVLGCTTSSRDRTLSQRPLKPQAPPQQQSHRGSSLGMLAGVDQDDARITALEPYTETVPTTTFELHMVPIPSGSIEIDGEMIEVKPFYILDSEVTWDAYDIFLFEKDKDAGLTSDAVDAVTRPSKPYIPPDRGYGHEGYPAIGIAHQAAEAFCAWLSAHTGRTYRLPTEHEWQFAASGGDAIAFDEAWLEAHAWTDENADFQTQPSRKKKPNARGLYDMFGNAAEWVNDVDEGDKPFIRGGHFMDSRDEFDMNMREYRTMEWSMSDPQVPKSPWWLSDGPFVGFRIVCEVEEDGARDANR